MKRVGEGIDDGHGGMFGEFIDRYPGSILVDQAIFTLGKSYQAQKDWVLAAAEFERLVRDFPESRSACDAEKALGECYWEQSRKPQYDQRETEQALIQFNRYLNRCPDHPDRAEAEEIVREGRDRLAEKCLRTARLYAKMKKRQSAVIYCDLLLADYGDSRWVCEARELRARLLIDLGRYAEARRTATRALKRPELPPICSCPIKKRSKRPVGNGEAR